MNIWLLGGYSIDIITINRRGFHKFAISECIILTEVNQTPDIGVEISIKKYKSHTNTLYHLHRFQAGFRKFNVKDIQNFAINSRQYIQM